MTLENRVDISKPSDVLIKFRGSGLMFYKDTSSQDRINVQHKVSAVRSHFVPDQPMYEELFHAYPYSERTSTQIYLNPSHPYKYEVKAWINTDDSLKKSLFKSFGFSEETDSILSEVYRHNLVLEDNMYFYEALEFSDAIYSGITRF